MVHTPGWFYNMGTAGVVLKLRLFSLMPTPRVHPSSEGEGHRWVSGSRALISRPFAARLIARLNTPKFCWRISLLVRRTFKIQRLLLSRVMKMHMKKMKLLWQCKRVANLRGECSASPGTSPSPWQWRGEGRTVAARRPPHHAPHSPSPLPAARTVPG